MADVAGLLQTMHAMREPPPPTPVVPFIVMLAIGCLCAVAGAVSALSAVRRRRGLRRSATDALTASRGLAPAERVAAQAGLLRRLVRSISGDAEARAQGPAWLETLDAAFNTDFFTRGAGRAYGETLYKPCVATLDVDLLDRSLLALIEKVRA